MPTLYPLDPTGALLSNKVTAETQVINGAAGANWHFIVPKAAPYFVDSLTITLKTFDNQIINLVKGIDWFPSYRFESASDSLAYPVAGGVSLIDLSLSGVATLEYQTLGDKWVIDYATVMQYASDSLRNPRTITWEQLVNLPEVFPPSQHTDDINDLKNMQDVYQALISISEKIAQLGLNPRPITPYLYQTKDQLGLSKVKNFDVADLDTAKLGQSHQHYLTPAGASALVNLMMVDFESTFSPRYRSDKMPVSGTFNRGNYVENTAPNTRLWISPGKLNGCTVVTKGWVRMTTGSTHVPSVDWVEDLAIVSD